MTSATCCSENLSKSHFNHFTSSECPQAMMIESLTVRNTRSKTWFVWLVPPLSTNTEIFVTRSSTIQPAARADLLSSSTPASCPLNESKSVSRRYFGNFMEVPPAVNYSTSNLGLILAHELSRGLVPSHTPETEIAAIKFIAKAKVQGYLFGKKCGGKRKYTMYIM